MYETERVLRGAVEAMAAGDVERLTTFFADDITAHVPGTNQLSGDYKGRDAVLEFLGKLMAMTEGQVALEPHDVVGGERHAVGIYTWRATRDGRTLEWRQTNVYHVSDDGKLVEVWQHPFDFERWNEFWS